MLKLLFNICKTALKDTPNPSENLNTYLSNTYFISKNLTLIRYSTLKLLLTPMKTICNSNFNNVHQKH